MNVAAALPTYDVITEDVEYLRTDGATLLARLYRPRGTGPFPAVVGVHGGAWTSGDRLNNEILDRAVAAAGAVVLAIDFRLAPQSPYPGSVADINYGIRWLKARAASLDSRADWVGAVASSSGGHQLLLNALRPRRFPLCRHANGGTGRCLARLRGRVLADRRSARPLPHGEGAGHRSSCQEP